MASSAVILSAMVITGMGQLVVVLDGFLHVSFFRRCAVEGALPSFFFTSELRE